jgi:ubiquinone/menaquinone biosynthesis C-methylase UbiE
MSSSSKKWKNEFNSDRRIKTYDATIDLFALRRDERLKVLQTLFPEVKNKDFCILELGAGTGIVTKILATHYPTAKIFAIDGANKMIDFAKSKRFFQENDSRIRWVVADYSSPAWQKEIVHAFHLVVSVDSLHHLTHKRKKELYKEIFEAITPGGVLLISDHVTSREPFYEDPQFSLWIEEIHERLAQKSEIAWFKKKLSSWVPEKIKGILTKDKKETFIGNLLREGENPMPLMDHIDSLRGVGFTDVIVEYRYSNFGIISARKGEEI